MNREPDSTLDGDWSVRRGLRLAHRLASGDIELIRSRLMEMPGVNDVRVRSGQSRVTLCYKLTRCQYGTLLRRLAELGYGLHRGLVQRFRTELYRLLDDNGRENATRPDGACCNRPPPRRR